MIQSPTQKFAERYPTDDVVVNDICDFIYQRLPTVICKPIQPHNDKPSIDEDWWVDEKINQQYVVPGVDDNELGLRHVYRWGRHLAIVNGYPHLCDFYRELLLHQMTELMPAILAKAASILRR